VGEAQGQERGAFEKALATEAKRHAAGGVVCGHIHTPALHDDFGLAYVNCGDWVESCTAAAERHDGTFEIISWTRIAGAPDHEAADAADLAPARAA